MAGREGGNSPVPAKRNKRKKADADPAVGCAVFDSWADSGMGQFQSRKAKGGEHGPCYAAGERGRPANSPSVQERSRAVS